MKEFIEKLIERLEEYKYSHLIERNSEQCEHCKDVEDCVNRDCSLCIWDKSIEIVNQLAEEHKGGWIPCDKELPKHTDYYNVTVGVCSEFGYYECVKTFRFLNIKGEEPRWDINKSGMNLYTVIAWQPLPKPYKPEGE